MGIVHRVAVGALVVALAGCVPETPEQVEGTAVPAGDLRSSTADGTAPSGSAPDGPLSTAVLKPTDIGRTYKLMPDTAEGGWSLDFVLSQCPLYGYPERPASLEYVYAELAVPDEDLWVLEGITREAPRVGSAVMGDLRAMVDRCPEIETEEARLALAVVDAGFAGEDAFLVETTIAGEPPDFSAFVRQGDLVAEVAFSPGTPQADARGIAVRAWRRLCAATPAC